MGRIASTIVASLVAASEMAPYMNHAPKEYWPSNRPRKPLPPVDKAKKEEIAAHNAEIDRIKAEKKERKMK